MEAGFFQRINQIDPCLGHCDEIFYRLSVQKIEAKMNELSDPVKQKISKAKLSHLARYGYFVSSGNDSGRHIHHRKGWTLTLESAIAAYSNLDRNKQVLIKRVSTCASNWPNKPNNCRKIYQSHLFCNKKAILV